MYSWSGRRVLTVDCVDVAMSVRLFIYMQAG